MKKILDTVILLSAFSTFSCKRAYECSCSSSQTVSYEAKMAEAQTEVAAKNAAEPAIVYDSEKNIRSIEKATKANAREECTDVETTVISTQQDDFDDNNNNNYLEAYYTKTTVSRTDCTLEKE